MFNLIVSFIKENWTYIVTGFSCLLSLIIFILKNKHNKNSHTFLDILKVLPLVINKAEELFQMIPKSGSKKFEWVLSQLRVMCNEINYKFDSDFWTEKIEEYLSTPQKK